MAAEHTKVTEKRGVKLQEINKLCSLQTSSLRFVSWFVLLWYPDMLQSPNILSFPLWSREKAFSLIFYSWSAAVQGE